MLFTKQYLKLNWQYKIKKVLIIAVVGLIMNTIVFHVALIYLPGTFVMILENLAPVFVFTATLIFYGIRPKSIEILALLLSFIGILFIVFGKSSFPELSGGFYIGVILGILTGVTFGGYIFFSADLMRDFKNAPNQIICFLFKIFVISAVACTPFLFTSKTLPSTSTQWFWLFEMGIMQSGLAYLFWNFALSHIKANTASILFLLTIIFTTINEIIFLNLKLNLYLILGGLCICGAGYLIKSMRQI